jgi:hypothetical protein
VRQRRSRVLANILHNGVALARAARPVGRKEGIVLTWLALYGSRILCPRASACFLRTSRRIPLPSRALMVLLCGPEFENSNAWVKISWLTGNTVFDNLKRAT